ncbi:MAG: ABC transporter ATP-binding protein [Cyanobacteria bacterium REEB65]|nr:ABC transporter ATP-binding protein [Cyanobacteria bacterium REEB65]
MNAIQLTGIKKFYKEGEGVVHAVDGIDLAIAPGEFAALAGPSGSGKTTLLNLIGGLDRPDSGILTVDGVSTTERSDDQLADLRLHKIGFVFQAYNLIPVLTVFENVQFVLQAQGVAEREHSERITPILRELGLAEMAHRFPTQLSGGQQQRVAVARAIVGNPAIVLADEPTANLDSETSASLLELMRRLNRENGITFLFSSHDPMVVDQASRVIRMRDGKIHEDARRD